MKKFVLIGIILLATVLRFYKLNEYPALNADEAALGYNAYSLLETGKDEHGNSWPIHFQSFNDYKPGMTVYLLIPFVELFGLNIFWLRFLPALLGVGTVYLVYLLVKELFNGQWPKINGKNNLAMNRELLAIIASFLLAINPWHIHFSRGAWEVNVATFFIVSGVYLFLRWVNHPQPLLHKEGGNHSILFQKKARWGFSLFISIICFALSLYTYHSARLIAPLLGFGLLLIYFKPVKKKYRNFILSAVLGLIILLPLFLDLTKGSVLSRASGVGLFADTGPVNRVNELRGEHKNINSFTTQLLHNKLFNYGLAFVENWTEHYHGEFLFLSGDDIQRNKVPETGQMYLFDIILIPFGLLYLIKYFKRKTLIVFWWLIISPIAASLTFQSPHALRSQIMVIPLVIISAFGLYYLLTLSKNNLSKRVFKFSVLIITIIISWNTSRYLHMYWVHMAKEYPFSSQYGVQELVNYINVAEKDFENVVITDRYDQPYILFLFYQQYPPEMFQKNHNLTSRDKFGFSTVREYDKYRFEAIDFEQARLQYPNSLIVGTDEEIPDEVNVVKEIYGINGHKYFEVVAN